MIYACREKPDIQVKEKVALVLLSYNSRAYLERFFTICVENRLFGLSIDHCG